MVTCCLRNSIRLCVLLLSFALARGFICRRCNPSDCADPSPDECAAGLVLDPCQCCKVCARANNESCGGLFGDLGKCGEGLRCVVNVVAGHRITGQEEGICQDSSHCPVLIEHYGCNLLKGECFCSTAASCGGHDFEYNSQKECEDNIHVVIDVDKCREVQCNDSITCPEDSNRLPSLVKEGECCPLHLGCECLPCTVPECEQGFTPVLKQSKTGKPGSCCDVYTCEQVTCTFKGTVYADKAQWKPDPCITCTCENGIAVCSKQDCASSFTNCGRNAIPQGECCPVCIGCITSSGAIYNNSESWDEDDCTKCSCENGQVNCQAEMCHVPCLNPIPKPGECCGFCNETSYISPPPECPLVDECTLTCMDGLQKDENGCFICECKEDECGLDCPHGYARDEKGFSLCKCIQEKEGCPSVQNCENHCRHGHKLDKNGCKTCSCNHCKKLKNCNRNCPFGLKIDSAGCPICKCSSDKSKSFPVSPKNCQMLDHSRPWYDGCRNCICMEGREMCSLITCPVLHCDHPTVVKGECCPKCLDDKIYIQANLSVCEGFNGHKYMEGETWNISSCISCLCREGRVLCETKSCPPIPCLNAVHKDGECCPSCTSKMEKPDTLFRKRPCFSENKKLAYLHGDKWRKDSCKSCICDNGKIECFSEICPRLSCSQPLQPKNRCCPVCPDVSSVSHCVYNDTVYADGQHWSPNACMHCDCLKGFIKCTEELCPKICHNPVKIPGQCCPECSGALYLETTEQSTIMSPTQSNTNVNKSFDDGKVDPHSNQQSSMYIALLAFGIIAFIVIIGLVFLFLLRLRHVDRKKTQDIHIIHYGKPKLTKLDYQGISSPAYFTALTDSKLTALGSGKQQYVMIDKSHETLS